MSLDAAVDMAVFEHELGVRSTYYVMARSPYYNAASWDARDALRRIARLGHELGVHVDLDEPRDAPPRPVWPAIERERHLLGLAGISRRVSFHCPPRHVLWRDIAGYDSAYAAGWEGRYYSDSDGAFSYGDPEDHPGGPLQINLHPEHWFGGMPATGDRPGFWR